MELLVLEFSLSRLGWCSVYRTEACVAYAKQAGTRSKRMHWMDARALKGRTLSEAKGHGEIPSVIHGSPIGKPYPSSVASLRSFGLFKLSELKHLSS
ncbi:UNVERIFIED_CONTAM: hypothetical protein Sradi_7187700 [Sesamum radiatum]|uniref:Uncharacterized protein n=1 Tax=Sesamum radiatum TaxID=300843 RepID=A0AAW2ISQ9_SESRA